MRGSATWLKGPSLPLLGRQGLQRHLEYLSASRPRNWNATFSPVQRKLGAERLVQIRGAIYETTLGAGRGGRRVRLDRAAKARRLPTTRSETAGEAHPYDEPIVGSGDAGTHPEVAHA